MEPPEQPRLEARLKLTSEHKPCLQRRSEAGGASVQTDKTFCKVCINQVFFFFVCFCSDCLDWMCFANTAVGPGRRLKTQQLDGSPRKEDGGLCPLERKSGVDKRMPGAAGFVSRSGQAQIKGIVFSKGSPGCTEYLRAQC